MAHVTIDDAKEWISQNGIDTYWYQQQLNNPERLEPIKWPSLEYIAQLLERVPGLTKEQLRQLSATDPGALVGENGGGVEFYNWAKYMLNQFGAGNNTLTFFIDRGGTSPFAGDIPQQDADKDLARLVVSKTLPPDEDTVNFIRRTMKAYEELTGGTLRFTEVYEDDQAAISFYKMTPIKLSNDPTRTLLGQSTSAQSEQGVKWRNVFYNDGNDPGSNGVATMRNTIVHEMGHTIGFRHPTDLATQEFGLGGIGLNWLYDDYDTIMSYNRRPRPYSTRLTDADKNAYRYWWQDFRGSDLASDSGKSLGKSSSLTEVARYYLENNKLPPNLLNPNRDYITGSSRGDWYVGDQSDDTWHGGDGDDNYFYKGGFDFASGQDGRDTFYIDPLNENGYLTIKDFTAGQDRLVFQSYADYDIFAFGGATFVLGSDTDKVVFLKGEFTEQQLLGHAGAQLGIA